MNTTSTSADKASQAPDDIGRHLEILRADIAALASTIADDLSSGIEQTGHRIGQTGRNVHASAMNGVRGHPLRAVAFAGAIGLLFGLVARQY